MSTVIPESGGRNSRTTALARLDGGKLVPVASGLTFPTVSADDTKIAGLNNGKIVVTDRNGGQQRTLGSGLADVGYEPAWSPAGDRLLVAKGPEGATPTHGVITVATGTFTPLAHNPGGIHYLWSANGKRLGYATGTCRIGVADADADGGNARLVPGVESCDPFSLSPDGTKLALDVIQPGQEGGDIGPNLIADAIINTTTGKTIAIPVEGTITQILFQPDGTALVRSVRPNGKTLTILNADGSLGATVTEPAIAKNWILTAYR